MQTNGRVTAARRAQARRRLSTTTSDVVAAAVLATPAAGPAPPRPENDPEPVLTRPRSRRERWLPSSWRGARIDPGRRGALALAGVAAVAAVLAAVGAWRDRPVAQTAPALAPVVALAPAARSTGAPASEPLVVSVAGAVQTPGLVTLATGARVADALAAAGGALPGTDLLTLNLAEPLHDGQQVLVGVPGVPVTGASNGATGPDALVNLNTSTAAELETLPGVGPVMAKAITDFRAKNGPFTRVDQLDDVSGFGAARLAQLRDRVTV